MQNNEIREITSRKTQEILENYISLDREMKDLKERITQAKAQVLELFNSPKYQGMSFIIDGRKIIKQEEYTSERVDSKKLAEEYPDIYYQVLKDVIMPACVKVLAYKE